MKNSDIKYDNRKTEMKVVNLSNLKEQLGFWKGFSAGLIIGYIIYLLMFYIVLKIK